MVAATGPTATRAEILTSVATASTRPLADRLLDEFEELTRRYQLGDFRPSELSGGRFGEASFRICEQACFGTHTALGKTLPNCDELVKKLESSGTADDAYRIHIPRATRV